MAKGTLHPSVSFLLNGGVLFDVANELSHSDEPYLTQPLALYRRWYIGEDIRQISNNAGEYKLAPLSSSGSPQSHII